MNEAKALKKAERREKRNAKIRKKLLNPEDMKYRGPLSYRYLRGFSWLFIILSQLAFLASLSAQLIDWSPISSVGENVLSSIGGMATPLFIIASFASALSGYKGYRNLIVAYGGAFVAIGGGLCFAYARYIGGLLSAAGVGPETLKDLGEVLGERLGLNVFADLLALSSFHMFLNYTPTKYFQGHKIIVFRLCAMIPVLYAVASYTIKVNINLGTFIAPFYVYPFLCTKSPFVFLIFVCISLWIKNREKIFLKLGATREDYQKFLKTKRNSFSFSIILSLLIVVFAFIELIVGVILYFIYVIGKDLEIEMFYYLINSYGLGQSITMIFTIPFILLYSYTRAHKNNIIDIVLPVMGIGGVVILYVEYFYQMLTRILAS